MEISCKKCSCSDYNLRTCLYSRKIAKKKTMITKISMIFMVISVATVRKNHKNHGNHDQKGASFENLNRF